VAQPLASLAEMDAWTAIHVAELFKGHEGRRLGWEGAFARARRDGLVRVEFGDNVWMITQGAAAFLAPARTPVIGSDRNASGAGFRLFALPLGRADRRLVLEA
jgi:hypothetical protein